MTQKSEFGAFDVFIGMAYLLQGRKPPFFDPTLEGFPLADLGLAASAGTRHFAVNHRGKCLFRAKVINYELIERKLATSLTIYAHWVPLANEKPIRVQMVYDSLLAPNEYEKALTPSEPWMTFDFDIHYPFQERSFLSHGVINSVAYEPPGSGSHHDFVHVRISTIFPTALIPLNRLSDDD